MVYNIELIIIFFAIYFLDNISIYLNKLRFGDKEAHHNVRWFFIHFFINMFITLATFNDLKFCLKKY